MIKIGRCYFNESEIAAIEPDRDGDSADVFLARGSVIHVDVHEGDLQALLERAGILQTVGDPISLLEFSPVEHGALWQAWNDGYLYVAKDSTSQVYAYIGMPEKGRQTWRDSNSGEAPKRLPGDYSALSFEDDEPLSLAALFYSDAGEDEEK